MPDVETDLRQDEAGIRASILDAVGNTPLLRLPRGFDPEVRCEVLLKLEYVEPGGSVKDRIALHMVREARRKGLLAPGGRIVECSSGNTGAGLALVAAALGHPITVVIPDKMSTEKIATLEALGAEVVVTPANVPIEDPRHYTKVAERLAAECGGWWPNQYHNPDNAEAHYLSTGPEIWEQCGGRLDVFVAGAGTGGTLTGIGRFLKEKDPSVQVVGVDPPGSVLHDWYHRRELVEPHPYAVEGVGEEEIPAAWDPDVADDYLQVPDGESFRTARRLAAECGVFAGGSSGMNLAAALRVARGLPEDARVVTLLPDSGRAYLSKVYSEDWMRDQGYLPRVSAAAATVGDLLRRRERAQVQPDETLAWAVRQAGERGVRPLPVVDTAGALLGVLDEAAALDALADGRDLEALRVADFVAPAPPVLEPSRPWLRLREALAEHPAVLVALDDGYVPFDRRDLLRSLGRLDHQAR